MCDIRKVKVMPRTRSVAWSELKLGVIGLVALVLVTIVIVAVGGQGGFPWQRYPLKARFHEVNGLKTGAVVRLNGKEVGKVTGVEFAGSDIDVVFEVSDTVRHLITTESEASLGSLSLLGEPIIDIKAAEHGTPLQDWAYVTASRKTALGDLTTNASQSLEEAGRLIADVRAGRGSVGKLFTDQALYDEMHQFASSAAVVARYLRDGRGTLGSLAKDPAAYNELKASLEQLHTITQKIDTGDGPLGRLLNDQAMAKSLAGTSENFEQISGRLNRGEGTAGKLLTDQQLYDRFTNVANRLQQIVAGVEAGQGTAGQLLKDQQLYENMNKAAGELRMLIAEIRKDPKKYLNVRVSIF
jgi:phospholipid/cholesterol/gamma-HCH transport system substrate-binding protein